MDIVREVMCTYIFLYPVKHMLDMTYYLKTSDINIYIYIYIYIYIFIISTRFENQYNSIICEVSYN